MNKKGTYMLGIFIMVFGIVLLFGQLGINIGWIIGLIIPIYFIYKGWQLFTGGNSTFKKGLGVILMAVGALWLTGMLPVILGLVIAAFLIYYGVKMIKNHKTLVVAPEIAMGEQVSNQSFSKSESQYSNYDQLDEWEKELYRKK